MKTRDVFSVTHAKEYGEPVYALPPTTLESGEKHCFLIKIRNEIEFGDAYMSDLEMGDYAGELVMEYEWTQDAESSLWHVTTTVEIDGRRIYEARVITASPRLPEVIV